MMAGCVQLRSLLVLVPQGGPNFRMQSKPELKLVLLGFFKSDIFDCFAIPDTQYCQPQNTGSWVIAYIAANSSFREKVKSSRTSEVKAQRGRTREIFGLFSITIEKIAVIGSETEFPPVTILITWQHMVTQVGLAEGNHS
jgi:hypothetical protein